MKVVVIGAGLAGLNAACELVDAGHDVIVLERRPWAGGKTYSFVERETGEAIDNGQHVLMGCTMAHRALLRRLGTDHLVRWQPRLRVPVIDARGRRSDLAASRLPAPLHLLPSFIRYAHLAAGDRLRAARAMIAISRMSETARLTLDSTTFADWLRGHGQTEAAIVSFWDLIVVPSLNAPSTQVSAAQALFVFREGILASPDSAAIGISAVPLTELHVAPAERYIRARGGDVVTGSSVAGIKVEGRSASGVMLASGEFIEGDAFVAAVPPDDLLEMLPEGLRAVPPFDCLGRFRSSPIVNVHCWFDGPVAEVPFVAFTGCDLQWAFFPEQPNSPRTHVVISLSAAGRYMPMAKAALLELLLPQLHAALPGTRSRRLLRAAIVKEPHATFVPAPGLRRPGPRTAIANLVLAGAYTDTGWPATMESAVRSGRSAASAVASMNEPAPSAVTAYAGVA